MLKRLSLLAVAGILVGSSAMAAGGKSARSMKNFGFVGQYGILSPEMSVSVAYQGSLARLSAGYMFSTPGRVLGSLQLFVPSWSLSPTVGARATYATSGANPLSLQGVGGIDYQNRAGFQFGAGVLYGFSGVTGLSYYFQLGWFFGKGK